MTDPAPDTVDDEEDLDVGEVNGRMCIATRESGSPETLIRFVAAPDGTIVPDLKRALPGRGCWVSPSRAAVDKAVAKKLFARALKRDVKVDADLGQTVDRLLAQQLAGMINLARKAWHLGMETDAAIPAFHLLSGAEMDELMGQNAFIHAAVLAGQAGEGVVKRANLLEQYRTGGLSQIKDVADMPKQ